jgi:hypothetical protein
MLCSTATDIPLSPRLFPDVDELVVFCVAAPSETMVNLACQIPDGQDYFLDKYVHFWETLLTKFSIGIPNATRASRSLPAHCANAARRKRRHPGRRERGETRKSLMAAGVQSGI